MIKIEFVFNIGDRVKIKEISRIGRVVSLYYAETGDQYEVAYFNEGESKHCYFYSFELVLVKDGEDFQFGFKEH